MSFRRVYENSPSEHKITNVGSENCDIILWKENLPDTGKALYLTVNLFIFFFHHGASIMMMEKGQNQNPSNKTLGLPTMKGPKKGSPALPSKKKSIPDLKEFSIKN